MAEQRLLDLSVADVHVPSAMTRVGGVGGTPAAKGDRRLVHAALVVVRNPQGHVLTVSRPEPPHEQAIPGGLCEPGEDPMQAGTRELKEECGIDASALTHVTDLASPVDGRTVHVYSAHTYTGEPVAAEFGTRVAWMHPNDLLGQAKQFHTSVKAIMDAGGMSMPQAPTKTARDRAQRRRLHFRAPAATATRAAMSDVGGIALLAGHALLDDGGDKPRVWIQLAEVGKFSGHPAGDFELSPKVFSQICANFTRDKLPIPIDMEHASEQEPTEGTIPTHGAPASGWIHSLDNRGGAGLFGEVEWLEPAKSYIKEGKYRYISPAIRFESRDRVTGQPIGARLTSAGLTNQPFLRNMQPLVARDGARTAVYRMSAHSEKMPTKTENGIEQVVHEPAAEEEPEIHASMAHPPSEYMNLVRAALKMPDLATARECAEKLEKLRDMHAEHGHKTPDGVDLSDYMRSMRTLTNVGVGGTWEDVFSLMSDLIDAATPMADKGKPKKPKAEPGGDGEHGAEDEDEESDGAGVDASDKSTQATNRTTETITMADDTLVVALREANGSIGTLTLALKDTKHQLSLAQVKIDQLEAEKTLRDEEALQNKVHVAFATYKDARKLSDKDRPHMLAIAKATPDAFDSMYPPVPPQHRHLMRDITPPAPKTTTETISASDGHTLTFSELTAKFQKDRKMSFEDAQNEAVRMLRSAGRAA